MEARVDQLPHRSRNLRLLNDLARRTLDTPTPMARPRRARTGRAQLIVAAARQALPKTPTRFRNLVRGADEPPRPRPPSMSAAAAAVREAHATVLPGYHLNKRHWNTVIIDGPLPEQMVKDMIEDSKDLVVSKPPHARRRALGWHGDDEHV